jgi:hypothetical protein
MSTFNPNFQPEDYDNMGRLKTEIPHKDVLKDTGEDLAPEE